MDNQATNNIFNHACIKHNLNWDFEGECPRCQREEYEEKFRQDCELKVQKKYIRIIKKQEEILDVYKNDVNKLEKKRDELVEALKVCLDDIECLETGDNLSLNFIKVRIKQAISKAQGGDI